MARTHIIHPIPPLYNLESQILILGSFPSVKSREQQFFYGHKQNRFWKVIAAVFEEPVPETIPDKKAFLLRNHIAVWDVIYSCDIEGSSDSSIRNVTPTNLKEIIQSSQIQRVFCNGKTSGQYYKKYQLAETGMEAAVLPSTSPANAAWKLEGLIAEWKRQICNHE